MDGARGAQSPFIWVLTLNCVNVVRLLHLLAVMKCVVMTVDGEGWYSGRLGYIQRTTRNHDNVWTTKNLALMVYCGVCCTWEYAVLGICLYPVYASLLCMPVLGIC
jgi:hypothetical protein